MVRTYSVRYKSKSKMLTDAAAVADARKSILDETAATAVEIKDDGQVITIEAAQEDFSEVMNTVVNVFRKIDDRSEVTYNFALNNN